MARGLDNHDSAICGRAFVSYTQEDEAWATWIAHELEQDGWKADLQAWDVVPGVNFLAWMNARLAVADHVVLVMSRASLAAGWVGAEWQSAFAPGERRVIPVRIEDVEANGVLAKIVRIDLFDLDQDDARHRLVRQMRAARAGTQPRPTTRPLFPGGSGTAPPRPVAEGPDGTERRPSFPGSIGVSSLLDRVTAAALARWPGSLRATGKTTIGLPYLDMDAEIDGERREWGIGILGGHPLDAATLTSFRDEVHVQYEELDEYAESELVCGVTPIAPELVKRGRRLGITVRSLADFEGRWDPSAYLARQTARIEQNSLYPADLYVAQRYVDLDGTRGDNLCASMIDWLDADEARFLLVLGDFGHGKTFVLRELARRLPAELPKIVPMLVELKDLEKSQSIDDLLALHLQKSGEDGVSVRAVRRMLARGRVVLLFDGFDELAMRVTYDRAAEHLAMIASAVSDRAKVVLTSRTQHFASDDQWRTALGERAKAFAGSRAVRVTDFDEAQIHEFLTRLFARRLAGDGWRTAAKPGGDTARERADKRLALIRDIRDLLGLSGNPRMLSFIANLHESDLLGARSGNGTISSAGLYALLVGQWLRYEAQRRWPSPRSDQDRGLRQLRAAVDELARHLWESGEDATDLDGLAAAVQRAVTDLSASRLDPRQATFMVGSGSLLVRNDEDRFQFVHRSVLEYLVAASTAERIGAAPDDVAALGSRQLSDLMVDFLVHSMDRATLTASVRAALRDRRPDVGPGGALRENLLRVASRLGLPGTGLDLSGQDLRGQDLSGQDLRSANLAGARLAGVRWHDIDLSNADLSGVDATGARLDRVTLTGARLDGSSWRGAVLVGATLDPDATLSGAAVVGRDPATPMVLPRSVRATTIDHSPDGAYLAAAWGPSLVLHDAVSLRPVRVVHHDLQDAAMLLFGPDVGALTSMTRNGRLTSWRTTDGTRLPHRTGPGQVLTIIRTLLGDVRAVASVESPLDRDGPAVTEIVIWDVVTGETEAPDIARRFSLVEPSHLGATPGEILVDPPGSRLYHLMWHRSDRDRPTLLRSTRLTRPGPDDRLDSSAQWPFVHDAALHPYGTVIALGTGKEDSPGIVQLDDEQGGRVELDGYAGAVTTVLFSPDGRRLATGDTGGVCRRTRLGNFRTRPASLGMVDTDAVDGRMSRRLLWRTEVEPDQRRAVSFSRDGSRLVGAGSVLRSWDVETGADLARWEPGRRRTIDSLAFTADGRHLVTSVHAEDEGRIDWWRLATGERGSAPGRTAFTRLTYGCRNAIGLIAADPSESMIAASVQDDSVPESPATWVEYLRVPWPPSAGIGGPNSYRVPGSVSALALAPRNRCVAIASSVDGGRSTGVRVIELAASEPDRRWRFLERSVPMTGEIGTLAFSPDGDLLAGTRLSAALPPAVLLWSRSGGTPKVIGAQHVVTAIAFRPDGNVLAGGEDIAGRGRILRWDAHSGAQLNPVGTHDGSVTTVVYDPTGTLLASGDAGTRSGVGHVRLWDATTGRLVAELSEHVGGVTALAFSPDGRLLASGGADGTVQIWDIAECRRLATIVMFEDGASAVLLPDGSYKLDGDPGGELWWSVGLARFEPGEVDAFDPRVRRLPNDAVIPGLDRYT